MLSGIAEPPGYPLSDLRHTSISYLLDTGALVNKVEGRFGQSLVGITTGVLGNIMVWISRTV